MMIEAAAHLVQIIEADAVKNAVDVLRWAIIFSIALGWFVVYMRNKTIMALKDEVSALSERVERLDSEVTHLRGTLIRYGCRRAPECDKWARFVDEYNLDPVLDNL